MSPALVTVVLLAVSRDPKYEAELRARLEPMSAEAVPIFEKASQMKDPADALPLYQKVTELAPDFDAGHRRLCWALRSLGRHEEAERSCRRAFELNPDAWQNELSMALALAGRPEALQHARRAAERSGGDLDALATWCDAEGRAQNMDGFRKCVGRLRQEDRDSMAANYFGALLAATEERWDDALALLDDAHRAGLDDPEYARLRTQIEEHRPHWPALLVIGLWVAGAWLALLAILLAVGLSLSAATTRSAEEAAGRADAEASPGEQRLRRIYRRVIWACGVYFYASVPLILAAVVGLGGLALYAVISMGRVPIKLLLVIGGLVVVTVWAVLRSVFVRVRDEDPGVRLRDEPKLEAVLAEVAAAIHTAPVDAVYMTPGTDVAVMQRGGLLTRLFGRGERCLILGVGVLDGWTLRPFKAVLGHEYGHLRNQDTAGGGFASAVERSLLGMITRIGQAGAATWYNPAWWFLRGYLSVFFRISKGASRLQEILADRWAATAYGAAAFEKGLTHVVGRVLEFGLMSKRTLGEVIEAKRPLANLYSYQPEDKITDEVRAKLDTAVAASLDRPGSAYDSHPPPRQRIAWVHALGAEGMAPQADDGEPVWSLFADREQVERRMTDEVRRNVERNHGVKIAAE